MEEYEYESTRISLNTSIVKDPIGVLRVVRPYIYTFNENIEDIAEDLHQINFQSNRKFSKELKEDFDKIIPNLKKINNQLEKIKKKLDKY